MTPQAAALPFFAPAQRQLGGNPIFLFIMNDGLAISETTVADLLTASPRAVRFFIEEGTACAVCPLARFCTLKDVVHAYELNEPHFIEHLAKLNIQKL